MSKEQDEDAQAMLWRTIAKLWEDNKRLRAAVASWPEQEHPNVCDIGQADGCVCGAESANMARAQARQAAGLED